MFPKWVIDHWLPVVRIPPGLALSFPQFLLPTKANYCRVLNQAPERVMVNVFGGRGIQALSSSGFRTKKQFQEGDTIYHGIMIWTVVFYFKLRKLCNFLLKKIAYICKKQNNTLCKRGQLFSQAFGKWILSNIKSAWECDHRVQNECSAFLASFMRKTLPFLIMFWTIHTDPSGSNLSLWGLGKDQS